MPIAVYLSGHYVYLSCDTGLSIIDVERPQLPEEVSNYYIDGYSSDIIYYFDETMEENYVFLASCWNGMKLFNVFDVTHPYPCPEGDFHTPAASYSVFKKGSYVYVGSESFLEIIDIDDISQPKEIGSLYFQPPINLCKDVYVNDNFAYIGGFEQFRIVDVSDPSSPQIESSLNVEFSINQILVRDNFAYVTGGVYGIGGYFQIIDVSNPEYPEKKGKLSGGINALGLCIVENYAYVCWNSEVGIIDISNPDSPELMESFNIYGGAWDVDVSGSFLYVAAGILGGLKIFDISDPLHPEEISSITTTDYVIDIKISNNYLYAATMGPRLIVFDVSNPYIPLEVGFYSTPGYSFEVDASEGFLYVADFNAGLQIYKNNLLLTGIGDPLSLAYNGNEHLVREPNTDNLHLVYTDAGNVWYRYSDSGGEVWSLADNLGEGNFPAIVLDSNNNPLVSWTDGNYLFFSRKNPIQGWEQTEYTFGSLQPSHPSIVVTTPWVADIDSVHILVRLFQGGGFASNSIVEISFLSSTPGNYQTRTLDTSSGPFNMITLEFPSIAKDYENTLHASWMHADTIYYGTRAEGANWNVWGNRFGDEGLQSAHPFVETYGDSIFVVWQNASDDEVYRGYRHLQYNFSWANLSQTPTTPSIYPVNASGMVTTFLDKLSVLNNYDIFWKTSPDDPLHNISNTRLVKSTYPHTSLWIREMMLPLQYTVWLEGNSSPYEIKCKESIIGYGPGKGRDSLSVTAYFSSIPGSETPSLYLTKRDSFIPDWQIPVDAGYETITYQFPLDPNYKYRLKAIAYQEKDDKWKTKVTVDGEDIGEIEYEPYKPETLECLIPESFYKDSLIEVTLKCDDGSFAALGPIYIYRYEYGEEGKGGRSGGPMLQGTVNRNKFSLSMFPNPFKERLNIKYQTDKNSKINIKIYDICGRLVKEFKQTSNSSINRIVWKGDDKNGRAVPQAVYFLQIHNIDTDETFSRKLIKLQ